MCQALKINVTDADISGLGAVLEPNRDTNKWRSSEICPDERCCGQEQPK